MAQIPEAEIKRLVAIYRKGVKDLTEGFVARVTLDNARVAVLVRRAMGVLERIDRSAGAWALNLAKVYNATRQEVEDLIEEGSLGHCNNKSTNRSRSASQRTLQAIVEDPSVGFISALRKATDGIRNRLRLIRSQTRSLAREAQTIDEVIDRVGSVRGATAEEVKSAIVRELLSRKAASNLKWRARATGLGQQHILSNIANLPYVAMMRGHLRLDRYAELVARSKGKQAEAMAQRRVLIEHCQGLISISRNLPEKDDACTLFIGRVFALTKEAADEFGVPHVDQLPGGGAPFHPSCTHREVPFFPEIMRQSVVERATSRPPNWALGRSWAEVEKEYQARGGAAYGSSQNPNVPGSGAHITERNEKAVAARQRRKAALAKRRQAG